ncbi:MAG TPA: DUF4282 domain-containing protein [Rhodothermales bacterium]|nr:DUF4282 domain-containing protein [Rhodothermales bacterium]
MRKEDFLFFDKMLTPKIITLVYWLMLIGAVIGGLTTIFAGQFLYGIVILVGGAIAARIWCELLIVLFKMNEALQELRPGGYSTVDEATSPGTGDY